MSIVQTNKEVIRFLRNRISSLNNKPESTTPFSDRLVYEALRVSRARLLSDKMRARIPISLENNQSIPCLKIVEAEEVDCPCAPKSGCTFRVSENDIPTPIGTFFKVSSLGGEITYSYVEWDRFKNKINGRRASSRSRGYYTTKNTKRGVKLYLYNDIHKEYITVTSVFADPIKIYEYPRCDGTAEKCAEYLSFPFPIDPDLLGATYELATQTLRPIAPSDDKLNNESDDSYSQTPLK